MGASFPAEDHQRGFAAQARMAARGRHRGQARAERLRAESTLPGGGDELAWSEAHRVGAIEALELVGIAVRNGDPALTGASTAWSGPARDWRRVAAGRPE